MRAELVLDCKNEHGEGIFWNHLDNRLWWTDIEGRMIHSYDPKSKLYNAVIQAIEYAVLLHENVVDL